MPPETRTVVCAERPAHILVSLFSPKDLHERWDAAFKISFFNTIRELAPESSTDDILRVLVPLLKNRISARDTSCKTRLELGTKSLCCPKEILAIGDAAIVAGTQAAIQAALQATFQDSESPDQMRKIAAVFLHIMARIKVRKGNMPTPDEAGEIRKILLLKDSLHIPDDQFCEKGVEYVALARRALAAYDEQS